MAALRNTVSGGDPIVVIGGGLIGVATAYSLAENGREVIVLDAGTEVAGETSFANGGMLSPSTSDPWNAPGISRHLFASLLDPSSALKLRLGAIPGLALWGLRFLGNATPGRYQAAALASYRLAAESVRQTAAATDALGLRYDAGLGGTMKLFKTAAGMDHALGLSRMLEAEGLRYEAISSEALAQAEPALAGTAERFAGALRFPDDKLGDARLFSQALAGHAERLGVAFHFGERVTQLALRGGAVAGVVTARGTIAASAVVIAAGNGSPAIARKAGVRLMIKPAKGYSLTIDGLDRSRLPMDATVHDDRHVAVVPLGNRVRLVGTAEFAGQDRSVNPQRLAGLRQTFEDLFPALAASVDWAAATPWAGLRPMTTDGLPYIGETKVPGLWINSGHGYLGWTLAMGSAALLTALITGATPTVEAHPYRVHR